MDVDSGMPLGEAVYVADAEVSEDQDTDMFENLII